MVKNKWREMCTINKPAVSKQFSIHPAEIFLSENNVFSLPYLHSKLPTVIMIDKFVLSIQYLPLEF